MFRANNQRTGVYIENGLERQPNLKWKTKISLATSPLNQLENICLTIQNNYVIVSQQDGVLNRLDRATGEIVWSIKVGDKIVSHHTISNGIIYLVVIRKTLDANYECLIAVDLESHRESWTNELASKASLSVDIEAFIELIDPFKNSYVISPLIDRDTIYVNSSNGNLYAIEVSNGREKWCF